LSYFNVNRVLLGFALFPIIEYSSCVPAARG
jgi:hypothetical protein